MKKLFISSLLLALVVTGCSKTPKVKNLTIEEAKAKALSFINDSLMQPGNKAEVKEIVEEGGLYKLKVSANGQEIDSYLTKDGSKFFPQVMDVEAVTKQVADSKGGAAATGKDAAAAPVATAPKADKVTVDLYVMGFCPYGVTAENDMAPVYELLKNKADINIRYIASIADGSKDLSAVQSLHGPAEGVEDARQLCIAKNDGKDKLWKYVTEIDKNCYPLQSKSDDAYTKCWKAAAKTAGVDATKVEKCVSSDGVSMIQAADKMASGNSVSGSPTLIINGAKINATRSPEGYKAAICGAFNTPPAECSKTLAGANAAPAAGGCGN